MEVDALHNQDFSYDLRLWAISLMHKDSLKETSRWQESRDSMQ